MPAALGPIAADKNRRRRAQQRESKARRADFRLMYEFDAAVVNVEFLLETANLTSPLDDADEHEHADRLRRAIERLFQFEDLVAGLASLLAEATCRQRPQTSVPSSEGQIGETRE
jgi:hypothetical protein